MEKITTLFTEEQVDEKISEIANCINADYADCKNLLVVGILRGGVYFMTELTKKINVPVSIDFIAMSSYGDGTISSGNVKITKELETDIEGKDVLIVEDIIDTGRTLSCLFELLQERKPASLKLTTLLNKPDRRIPQATVTPDYEGFIIPDYFVVGYGLDYAQRYRNLPYIGMVEIDDK